MDGSAQLTITGSLTIPAGKEFNINSNGLLKVRGNWTNQGLFFSGVGTVEFYGNANGAISGTNPPAFNKVIISKTSPYSFDFNVNTTVTNTFNVNSGSTFKVKSGKTLIVQGTEVY
jgi:hypothetical protein